jgi:hypothetical protein
MDESLFTQEMRDEDAPAMAALMNARRFIIEPDSLFGVPPSGGLCA